MNEDIMTGNLDDLLGDTEEYRAAMEKDCRDRQSLMYGEEHRLRLRFQPGDGPTPEIVCLDPRGEGKPCYQKGEPQDCQVAFEVREIGWDAFEPYHAERALGYTESAVMTFDQPVRFYWNGGGEDYESYWGIDVGPADQ